MTSLKPIDCRSSPRSNAVKNEFITVLTTFLAPLRVTHASGAQHRLASNERLEFLGDAILGFIVCEILYHNYPDLLEGELTKIKSVVVSRQTCAKSARPCASTNS